MYKKIILCFMIILSMIFMILRFYPITLTDIDGNEYKTIKIGNQIWMAENLRVTKYNDGKPIKYISKRDEWEKDTLGAFCYFNNTKNLDSIKLFGALYNWYAVEKSRIAPDGWRVPSKEDWETLKKYLVEKGYDSYDHKDTIGGIGRALAANYGWPKIEYPNPEHFDVNIKGNNKTGFSALPSGYREYWGTFNNYGSTSYWWSSSKNLEFNSPEVFYIVSGFNSLNNGVLRENYGYSIRLIKD